MVRNMVGPWRLTLAVVLALGLATACGSPEQDTAAGSSGAQASPGDAAAADDSGTASDAGEPIKVGFVYVGPIGDAGWTYRHDVGRLDLEEALGDQVETSYVENVPEGTASERVFEDLAREGHDVIVGTAFGYMDQMLAVAESYPEIVFLHAGGFTTTENLVPYFGAAEEGRYLEGIAAASVADNGSLGFVAPFGIPEVTRSLNSWTLGARSVIPDATVRVVWTSTWHDPAIEREAAQSLLDVGVEVIGQHQDTPAAGQVAEEAGAHWTGMWADMQQFAPQAWLTGTIFDWGPYYIRTVEQVRDGTWEPEEYYGNIADGMIVLGPLGEAVDAETSQRIEEVQDQIVAGDFTPFTGPIRDQEGEVRYEEGEQASLEEALEMDWLVEGVVGEIPQE